MARVMFGNGTSNSEGAVDGELPGIVNDTIDERWFKTTGRSIRGSCQVSVLFVSLWLPTAV